MVVILFLVGGVDAQKVVVAGDFMDQHVVHEAAMLVEQSGVLDLARLEAAGGVGGDEIGELKRLRAGDVDLAHVADIEDSDALADSEVLLDQRGILDGHVPTAEVHHFGASGAMDGVEAGGFERRSGKHQTGTVAIGWGGVKRWRRASVTRQTHPRREPAKAPLCRSHSPLPKTCNTLSS